jgi:hypothetical protein
MKILITIILSLVGLVIFKQENNQQLNQFNIYKNCFHSTSLPLILDRKAVFEIATYNTNKYQKIKDEFRDFIPTVLLSGNDSSSFRYVFALPNKETHIPLIIAKDYFEDNDQIRLDLYLIMYDKHGTILDFLEISGFKNDANETFVTIKDDFELVVSQYQHKFSKENKYPSLFYGIQHIKYFEIDNNGKLNCINQVSETGYFECDWVGYKLIYID